MYARKCYKINVNDAGLDLHYIVETVNDNRKTRHRTYIPLFPLNVLCALSFSPFDFGFSSVVFNADTESVAESEYACICQYKFICVYCRTSGFSQNTATIISFCFILLTLYNSYFISQFEHNTLCVHVCLFVCMYMFGRLNGIVSALPCMCIC